MTTTTDVRQAATRILDGMTVNKEKLARDCVAVCDNVDRLSAALVREQAKSAGLQRELDAAKAAARAQSSSSPFGDRTTGMPAGFNEVFGDLFKPQKQ